MLEENYDVSFRESTHKRNGIDAEKKPFKIICRGKLPNSSYYDVVNQSQFIQTDSLSANLLQNNNLINQYEQVNGNQQQQQQQHHIVPVNEQNNEEESTNGGGATDSNTEIWSCVFSADNTHLAWSCG